MDEVILAEAVAASEPMLALFDGAVRPLPCVNRDRDEQAAAPVTSAMPLERRPAVKMAPVALGH